MAAFSINDKVLYGVHGVCVIEDIRPLDFSKTKEKYYILKPAGDNKSAIYVPVGNENLESKMKRILSAAEINDLISDIPDEKEIWIDNENERKAAYSEIIKNNDRHAMIGIIKTLYLKRETLKSEKKKLKQSDERFLNEAENILYDEFSYVLNITKEQVVPFICNKIEISEK